jgi:hypothetical protein
MSQTHRALAMLALSLALVAATTAVAAAATPPTLIQDPHDRLLRNQQAAQADRTQAAVALARSMERSFKVTASPARIEDQHDRWLRNQQDGQAERTTAAVALARSMERTLTPGPATPVVAAQPGPAVPDAGVDVTATVLLGLVSGLVGGVAAIGGWILATRRHRPRPVPAS